MAYVLFAMLLFGASVMTHISFCRRKKAQGLQARACMFIALIFIVIYALGAYFAGQWNILDPHSFWGLPFKITAALIFILLIPVYLTFYVLTQLMSPSRKILLCIAGKGEASHADIVASISEEDFINTRLHDLCSSGCVNQIKGRYILSASGQKIAVVLNMMQGILGRGIGG